MKIYEYIQIDIDTGEVIEEVSYDYTGPVAQCGKGGGDISYESSPEQAQLFKLLQPLIEGVSEYGMHNMYRPMVERLFGGGGGKWNPMGGKSMDAGPFSPNLGAPSAPTLPSMQGVLTGVPPYNIPSAKNMMPGANWWADLDPSVKAGISAPYQDASKQLAEQLGAKGMTGSQASPYSGQAQAGMGQFWADAAPSMAQQGWGMVAPALQSEWGAQLGRNQMGYQQGLQESMTDYQNQIKQMQSDYGTAMQAWQMPFSLMGMTPQTLPTGIMQPQSGLDFGGGLLGGASMGLGASAAGVGMPWTAPLVGAGALGGLLGGK